MNHAQRFLLLADALCKVEPNVTRSGLFKPIRSQARHMVRNRPEEEEGSTYLRTLLRHLCVTGGAEIQQLPLRSGGRHQCLTAPGRTSETSHRRLKQCNMPDELAEMLLELLPPEFPPFSVKSPQRVWLVCFLNGILPDTTKPGWEYFQCSHRCVEFGLDGSVCVDPKCLVWEPASANYSRGYTAGICCLPCQHDVCRATRCQCAEIHHPPCL